MTYRNAFGKKIFLFSCACTVGLSGYASSDPPPAPAPKEPTSKADATKKDSPAHVKVMPLPRHVTLPAVTYSRAPDVEGEFKLDFSQHRFWFIVVIASWDTESGQISKLLNSHAKEFMKRDVGILALFSQDTLPNVQKWRNIHKPLYKNEFASRDFIDSLNNPSVPSVWFVGSHGEILENHELPTLSQLEASVQKSFVLTGF